MKTRENMLIYQLSLYFDTLILQGSESTNCESFIHPNPMYNLISFKPWELI